MNRTEQEFFSKAPSTPAPATYERAAQGASNELECLREIALYTRKIYSMLTTLFVYLPLIALAVWFVFLIINSKR